MKIETFTEEDIHEASYLAYPVWGEGHAANGNGEEFGLLMCEYIIRYGWYGAPYAFKITDKGKMVGCILAGNIKQDNGYYAHHGFERVAEFKSDEWKTDSDNYLTYIYRKRIY